MSKIRVAVRVRPFLPHEARDGCVAMSEGSLTLANRLTAERHDFSFDQCYWSVDDSTPSNPLADNAVLCEDIGREALQSAVKGFNACIFAYGTTGSGKSYSIRGEEDQPGVLPYICKRLFADVIARDDAHSYSVRVSYYEIYNERVIDLLSNTGAPLKVMVLPSKDQESLNVIVKDLEKRSVHSCKEMAQALLHGAARLSFQRTGLNDRASRSHSVFTIYLTKREGSERSRLSQINVVDLAGSEHVKQSGVVGDSLRETCHINASLTTLSRVIEAVNTFAGYLAKRMGLPISKLVVATNENDILKRFFESGEYKKATVEFTISPSMDIQVASNFERYLFYRFKGDTEKVRNALKQFSTEGVVTVDKVDGQVDPDFLAGRGGTSEVLATIQRVHEAEGYILDPHTAVGVFVAAELGLPGRTVCLATAHPAKFPESIVKAIGTPATHPTLEAIKDKEEKYTKLPNDQEAVMAFMRKSIDG